MEGFKPSIESNIAHDLVHNIHDIRKVLVKITNEFILNSFNYNLDTNTFTYSISEIKKLIEFVQSIEDQLSINEKLTDRFYQLAKDLRKKIDEIS